MKQTFAQIEALAMSLNACGSDLNITIQCMVMSADENAHTTCFEDKSMPASEYDAVALASLEFNLSYCDDMAVCQWFAENDVKW
jgi:hypothetical protein